MLRVMWRELETGSRTSLDGHEGGNPGYRQGLFYRVTAPALDPTRHRTISDTMVRIEFLRPSSVFLFTRHGSSQKLSVFAGALPIVEGGAC